MVWKRELQRWTAGRDIFGYLAAICILLGLGADNNAGEPDFTAERKAAEQAMKLCGAKLFRIYERAARDDIEVPYAAFNGPSRRVTIYRSDDKKVLQMLFAESGRDEHGALQKGWEEGTRYGYPTREQRGYVEKVKNALLEVELFHTDAKIVILFPRYVIDIGVTAKTDKDIKKNHDEAAQILHALYQGMIAQRLLPGADQSTPVKGSAVITVMCSGDRIVKNALCKIVDPAGNTHEVLTDEFGYAKAEI
ncbi:MAG: hypothetical protein N3A66_08130, partial [Planctomycetota bacterium]|nr:hypothetical protein [Planctomycetota bacterium]